MKVLVRTKLVSDIEVVNAETGEPMQGVTSLSFSINPDSSYLMLRLHDVDY